MIVVSCMMNIAIIGTGYVGLPTGLGFAELGHKVVCIDIDKDKVRDLNNAKATLYEKDLDELLVKHLKLKNIYFSSSYADVAKADVIMLAVGTPQEQNSGRANLEYIYAAASNLKNYLNTNYKVVAVKSTVPVGTCDEIEKIIDNKNVDVVSLPEFLREGYALEDFFNPDRIIIGSNSNKANEVLSDLYDGFSKDKLLFVSRRSSELIKYASNSFLAMKIHFINEMANLCEKTNANIKEVAKGIGLDSRIGSKFLNPGPGFGGSCFPKDTLALQSIASDYGVKLDLLDATIDGNQKRFKYIANKIINILNSLNSNTLAIYGLAFKNGTDDCRQSPAIDIIKELLNYQGLNIKAYDPKAINNARSILKDSIDYYNDKYECVKGVDLLVVLTEWEEFKYIDFDKLRNNMNSKVIFDARNIIENMTNDFKIINVGV